MGYQSGRPIKSLRSHATGGCCLVWVFCRFTWFETRPSQTNATAANSAGNHGPTVVSRKSRILVGQFATACWRPEVISFTRLLT